MEGDGVANDTAPRTKNVASSGRGKRLRQLAEISGAAAAVAAPQAVATAHDVEQAPPTKRPRNDTGAAASALRSRAGGLARALSVPVPSARHVAALGAMKRARHHNVVVNAQHDCRRDPARPQREPSPVRRSPRRAVTSAPMMPRMGSPGTNWRAGARAFVQPLARALSGPTSRASKKTVVGETPVKAAR